MFLLVRIATMPVLTIIVASAMIRLCIGKQRCSQNYSQNGCTADSNCFHK
nr:hypothetical protein [uncultured bacterium]